VPADVAPQTLRECLEVVAGELCVDLTLDPADE